jgi:hypothetical protein
MLAGFFAATVVSGSSSALRFGGDFGACSSRPEMTSSTSLDTSADGLDGGFAAAPKVNGDVVAEVLANDGTKPGPLGAGDEVPEGRRVNPPTLGGAGGAAAGFDAGGVGIAAATAPFDGFGPAPLASPIVDDLAGA